MHQLTRINFTGIHAPPTAVSGEALPGSRLISIVMFPDVPIPDPVWTLITMTWGQIVTHDMSMSMGTTQASKYTRLGGAVSICVNDSASIRDISFVAHDNGLD